MLKLKFHSMFIIVALMIMINISSAKRKNFSASKSVSKTPLATATIKGSWTWANPVFQRQYASGPYYYDIFRVVPSASGDHQFSSNGSVAAYGYLYLPLFNPLAPERNMINYGYPSGTNQQFQFTHDLESGISYYLVATTADFLEIGQYQLIVTSAAKTTITRITNLQPSMPNVTVQSAFSNLQPQMQSPCDASEYRSYDIYSLVPTANGTYICETASILDLEIRVHSPTFKPLETMLNLIGIHFSTAYRAQQQIEVDLIPSNQYYLVLSRNYYYSYTDKYRLTCRGSSRITLTKLTDNFVSIVKTSTFSLTTNSSFYSQGSSDAVYYYKVFRITVRQFGIYTFLGYSDIYLTQYLYDSYCTPILLYENRVPTVYASDSQAEFITKAKLTPDKDYYLVVTTEYEKVVADFNLTAVGPSPVSVAAVPDAVKSNVTLSSSLTLSSPKFTPCNGYYSNFYYRLFKISVPSLGLYTLRTQGSMDTYGCMYINRFDPISSSSNLISYDGQSGRNDQFAITTILKTNTTYYLAATTSRRNVVGSFTLVVSGPAKATVRAVSTP